MAVAAYFQQPQLHALPGRQRLEAGGSAVPKDLTVAINSFHRPGA
jgi:hypothetical protein